ncbi:NHL repeat-containing protein [Humisphaera borealis]|uniref:Calx-beta domain-containing protein n=1 Tax=Humisphaera borealis TaxID=2807512 RepID=A0A7M2WUE0_9BACT|nr:hypothetical protein [Humisphaera borealis]QOV89073.1 hypothetical protein IPV69_23095 [Humisphaera borealis]
MKDLTPRKSRPCLLETLETRCLMSAGSLDTTFGVAGSGKVLAQSVGFEIADVAVLPNGKVIAIGTLNKDFAVARLSTDGKLDRTFGGGDGVATADFGGEDNPDFGIGGDFANTVAIQADGKIVVAGGMTEDAWDNYGNTAVARFNTNGTLDNSFDGNGRMTINFTGVGESFANAIAIQPDGKLVVAGVANTAGTITIHLRTEDFAVARINPNGSLDTTFGKAGNGSFSGTAGRTGKITIGFGGETSEAATAISLAPNGKIYVGGSGGPGSQVRFAVARLTDQGSLDSSFSDGISGPGRFNNLFLPKSELRDLQAQPDGSVVLVGKFADNFAVARLTSAGKLDTNFAGTGHVETDLGGVDDARHVRVSKEGILVAGSSNGKFAMARFKTNGLLDGFFGQNGKVTTAAGIKDSILTTNLTSDGKILAVGRTGTMARFISAVPKVGIYSLDNSAREGAVDNQANFVVTRDAVYSFNTKVFFDIAASATVGSDYTTSLTFINSTTTTRTPGDLLPTTGVPTFQRRVCIEIPAGQSFVVVPIDVIDDTVNEGVETVKLTINANSLYRIDAADTATVSIQDNDAMIFGRL